MACLLPSGCGHHPGVPLSPAAGSWSSLRVSRSNWVSSSPPIPTGTPTSPAWGHPCVVTHGCTEPGLECPCRSAWGRCRSGHGRTQQSCVASDFRELEALQPPAHVLCPKCFFLEVAACPHSIHTAGTAEVSCWSQQPSLCAPCPWSPGPAMCPLNQAKDGPGHFPATKRSSFLYLPVALVPYPLTSSHRL